MICVNEFFGRFVLLRDGLRRKEGAFH